MSLSDNNTPVDNPFSISFRMFRKILSLNTVVIEKIKHVEEALAGAYIFDKKFLLEIVSELNELVREIINSLNALTNNRYFKIYKTYDDIALRLVELASDFTGPFDRSYVLPYDSVNMDLEHLVGSKNGVLGEMANFLRVRVPRGFAITIYAYRHFMETNGLFDQLDPIIKKKSFNKQGESQVAQLFHNAKIPAVIKEDIENELQNLVKQCGKGRSLAIRSSGFGEDGREQSFAGQFKSILEVKPDIDSVLKAYKEVLLSRFSYGICQYLGDGVSSRDLPMSVAVQEMISAKTSGVIYTRDPRNPNSNDLLITAIEGTASDLVSGYKMADRYYISRFHPHQLSASDILPRSKNYQKENDPIGFKQSGMRQGSCLLSRDFFYKLTETALLLEKIFSGPQDIEWSIDDKLVILQSRSLNLPEKPEPLPAEISQKLKEAPVIFREKGQGAQLGVATGRVVHVNNKTEPEKFPVGAIAVMRFPNPQFSPIVWKAAAVITDSGSPAGHLATIAREYRTPALFGTGNASEILQEGQEITIDVENKIIYEGIVGELLRLYEADEISYQSATELKILRRILRWVAPLFLTDPDSRDFVPEKIRTFHDIIRFCHEKAIDSLIHIYPGRDGLKGMPVRILQSPVPIQLRVIDIGGGLARELPKKSELTLELIKSIPLNAILKGLFNTAAWERDIVILGIKSILSSMTKPLSMLTNAPSFTGQNLAIISGDYCNLSLRLGYHFNVIDAFCSSNPDENYIYFRFVGGFADKEKRQKRARLISDILVGLFFKVKRTEDLIVAKARSFDFVQMQNVLSRLGELVGFTRQLDEQMTDDSLIDKFLKRFTEYIRLED